MKISTRSMFRTLLLAATMWTAAAVQAGEAQVQRPTYSLQAEQTGDGLARAGYPSGGHAHLSATYRY